MKKTLNLQSNYSAIENGYQLWIPLDCSVQIHEDDPVRLLNAVAERMNYRQIEAAYSRYGRIEYSPKILTKILVYGYMRMIISTRKIVQACKENICFMLPVGKHCFSQYMSVHRSLQVFLSGPEP